MLVQRYHIWRSLPFSMYSIGFIINLYIYSILYDYRNPSIPMQNHYTYCFQMLKQTQHFIFRTKSFCCSFHKPSYNFQAAPKCFQMLPEAPRSSQKLGKSIFRRFERAECGVIPRDRDDQEVARDSMTPPKTHFSKTKP